MKKIVIALIFLLVAMFICYIAPNYYINDSYKSDEVRIILNDKEITHDGKKLPQVAKIVDGKVMLSQDTVDILFDKWLYYDEKYDTLISTTDTGVAKMKIGSSELQIDGDSFDSGVAIQVIDNCIYVPIEALQDFYQISVVNNGKIIITTNNADYVSGTLQKKLKLRAYKKNFSKIIATCGVGEEIEVFGYRNEPEWVLVRNSKGDLGYAKMTDIACEQMSGNMLPPMDFPTPKVNMIWEYAENYTPDRSSEKKIDTIDVIAPTWIYLNDVEGNLKNTIDTNYIAWAHNQGYKIWATFKNDRMSIEKTSQVVTDMKIREKMINGLINICKTYHIDGINLDFENMRKEDSEEFSQFVRELSATLRKNGLVSSVDVTVPDGSDTWSLCYNRYQIADVADYLIVMTYDQYGSSSRMPGSVAELSWVEKNIEKLVERDGIDPNRIIIGIPLYSRLWWNKNDKWNNSSISMAGAKKYLQREHEWDQEAGQYFVSYEENGNQYMIWIEEEESVKAKLELIDQYNLSGAAYWRYGYETDDFWETISE